MTPESQLTSLCEHYSLPAGWSLAEHFVDDVRIGTIQVAMAGLIARASRGLELTGSAARVGQAPIDRAYYELLERVSLFDARDSKHPLCFRDARGNETGAADRDVLFPPQIANDGVRQSISNGAALQRTWAAACAAATAELVERDRVLRAWRGDFAPTTLDWSRSWLAPGDVYRMEAYRFGPATRYTVAGVFALPREPTTPLAYGFGADEDPGSAIRRAEGECIQRMAFLWGEEIPDRSPDPVPTPEFHQEYYLCPTNHDVLTRFLRGERVRSPKAHSHFDEESIRFVDVTPKSLAGRLWVAKAHAAGALQLHFGVDPAGDGLPHPVV